MNAKKETAAGSGYSSEMADGIRLRTGLLVILSAASVAIAFGASFYFALVSSQTAVARQFPELAPIVERLRSLLVLNTFGLVAVVIASFWILSRLVTARNFSTLGSVMKEMRNVSENRLPHPRESRGEGPFGDFARQWSILLSSLRESEEREIDSLDRALRSIGGPTSGESESLLRGLLERKRRRLDAVAGGSRTDRSEPAPADGSDDPLFMQPV